MPESRPAEQNERFTVIETDTGYAVWDDIQNGIHVDKEGIAEDFPSEWQADAYREEVRQAVSDTAPVNDKDIDEVLDDYPITVEIGGELRTFPNAAAAEDALNEVRKFPYAVGDTVYLEDGKAFIVISLPSATKRFISADTTPRIVCSDATAGSSTTPASCWQFTTARQRAARPIQ
ncbi:MAG: hypothetical protein ACOYIE_08230 [Agathobaculum sp.]|uniref:hypothetical protein n=1 Tax=Eubacteriales TaxID=186802 RepID=UPI001FAC7926|nr:hypothetical protein [Anaerotruncus rubiinfantis]